MAGQKIPIIKFFFIVYVHKCMKTADERLNAELRNYSTSGVKYSVSSVCVFALKHTIFSLFLWSCANCKIWKVQNKNLVFRCRNISQQTMMKFFFSVGYILI